MALGIDIKNKIRKFVYSRLLWIFILNSVLIIIPISGLTIIRSKDYRALNLRSIATRDLSRSIISGLNLNTSIKIISHLPVVAPYQRVLIIETDHIKKIYDTGWLTNYAIASFEYDLNITRIISKFVKNYPFPSLDDEEILKRMSPYIQQGTDKFSIIDYRYLYSINNFRTDSGTEYSLIILTDKSDLLNSSKTYKILLLFITLISMLTALLISAVYYRLMIKPLHILTREVELIKKNKKYPEKLFTMKNRVDEIGLLSKAFYNTSNELITQRESLEIFTSDVLHELKNPLTGIRNGMEILQAGYDKDIVREEMFELISRETGRIEKLLFDIRKYSLSDNEESLSQLCDPKTVLNNILSLYSKSEIRVNISCNNSIKLREEQFISVVTNLIDNAISFSPEKQSVSIDYYKEGIKSYLTISDKGPGIPFKDTDKIYNRFYTNRLSLNRESLHSGLGLSIVKNILNNNNHSISFHDNEPQGTVFVITFHNG